MDNLTGMLQVVIFLLLRFRPRPIPNFLPQLTLLKPGSHMSPIVGDLLSVIIQGENSQRILLMNNHRRWTSSMSATYEKQALFQSKALLEPVVSKAFSLNGR